MALLIRNLSQIATPQGRNAARGGAMRDLITIDRGVIVIEGERFAFVGRESEIPGELTIERDFDARGATALPGFVDSHTHIPFAGFRESEFNRRLRGESYEEIAASGGGIASTVHATRAASVEELVANVLQRASTMARYGTTTAEAKSGYGLDKACELKQLRPAGPGGRNRPSASFRPVWRPMSSRQRAAAVTRRATGMSRRSSRRSCPPSPKRTLPSSVMHSSSGGSSPAIRESRCCVLGGSSE